jgi:glycosyltransferase involved in cell wall biosynthesis
MSKLTAVVPYWNGGEYIGRLLDSLPPRMPVLIVDDHSDEPLQLNREGVTVVRPHNKGFFSGAVNEGMKRIKGDALILNQDVWFDGNDAWMSLIAENQERYAVIGDGVMKHPGWPNGYVQGTFMYIRRDAWEQVGEFNEKMYPLWGSTCEWQLRACRNGFQAKPMANIPGLNHREAKGVGPAISEAVRRWPGRRFKFLRTPPAVSVIVPCYNYGNVLPDAINSLLGGDTCLGEWEPQDFQSFEIVIVDDASTDGETREIVRSYEDHWKGIRVVMLDHNRGTPGALNAGVEASYGRFIHILSADDMRESWCLGKQYRHAHSNPHKAIYGDIQTFKQGMRLKVLKMREYDFDDMLYRNPMPAGIMYYRESWVEAGGYPERMVYGREDWAFNIALGVKGICGHKMPGLSGNLCRREGNNRSVRTMGREWRERWLSQLGSLYPNLYEGERPVGCCGGNRRKTNPNLGRRNPGRMTMAGMPNPLTNREEQGLKLLEYVGGNVGSTNFYGPATGTVYKFGNNPKDKVKYVHVDDAEAMLNLLKHKRALFSVYVAPKPAPKPVDLGIKEEEIAKVQDAIGVEIEATDRALQLAEARGLDLTTVVGSGRGGRITVQDVKNALLE